MPPILFKIKSNADVKTLSCEELEKLCLELRGEIIDAVSKNGGHLAPNLGTVELTAALHKVFDLPQDKILWDVGHQSYTHKLLTGRAEKFHTLRQDGGICGFPSPAESEYDCFIAGHAGTAVSAAMGFAAARDARGGKEHVIAVVGDGSLNNGITLEALNNVRGTCKRLIIILNDNKMSISQSVGALRNYLNRIITGQGYNRFKAIAKMAVQRLPKSAGVIESIQKIESATKGLIVPGVFFEEMGIRYVGPVNGHNIPELVKTLTSVKDFLKPVIIHVITEKGHGYEYAAQSPERYHGVSSFDPDTGLSESSSRETFSSVFGDELCKAAEEIPSLVAVTAAMPSGTGLAPFAEKFPARFFDQGITEEHCVVFAAGLAAAGMRPVVPLYATFLQRTLDPLFHDVCLQNLPVVLCADRAGAVDDGPTHHGFADEPFLLAMPNLSVLAPKNGAELRKMLRMSIDHASPCVIRYPRGESGIRDAEVSPMEWGRAERFREGSDIVIWSVGRELKTALETAEILKKHSVNCRIVNTRFLKPFDSEAFLEDARKMPVATMEDAPAGSGLDGITDRLLVNATHKGILHFSWPSGHPLPHGTVKGLREKYAFTAEKMAEKILQVFFAGR